MSNPLVTLQSKIRAVLKVSFSQESQLDLALSGHLCCPALWPLSSPASSGRTSRISIFFARESLKVGGFTCTGCPSLGALREVRDPLCRAASQAHSLPLPWLCACLTTFPLSSQRAGGKSSSKDIRRLWIRVCIPYQVPRAQKLSVVSYSHLFLVRHPLMRIGSHGREGRRKLHKQNKNVIKFLLQISRSGLDCYFFSFWHILGSSLRNSLLKEAQRAG